MCAANGARIAMSVTCRLRRAGLLPFHQRMESRSTRRSMNRRMFVLSFIKADQFRHLILFDELFLLKLFLDEFFCRSKNVSFLKFRQFIIQTMVRLLEFPELSAGLA